MLKGCWLFLTLLLALTLSPFASATYFCAGTSLCLEYNQTYQLPIAYNFQYPSVDFNGTNFIIGGQSNSANNDVVYVFDDSFNSVENISVAQYTNGCYFYNYSGTPGIMCIKSSTLFMFYDLSGNYISNVTRTSSSSFAGGCDWEPTDELFYCADSIPSRIYACDITGDCSVYVSPSYDVWNKQPHVLETSPNVIIYSGYPSGATDKILYAYDMLSEISLGYLDLGATWPSVYDFGEPSGQTSNTDNTKYWQAIWNQTDNTYYVVEFNTNATHTYSTVGLTSPEDGDTLTDSNIVMSVALFSAYTGTLNCSIDNETVYSEFFDVGIHSSEFASGSLDTGEHTWNCIFTDTSSYSYNSVTNTFYISPVGTGGNLGAVWGNAIADGLGLATDGLGTASEKGMAFLGIIIALSVAVGVGAYLKDKKGNTSPEIAGIVMVVMVLLLTMVGWIPIWITIIFTIIAGVLLIAMIKKS